jgi:hypothetical protein
VVARYLEDLGIPAQRLKVFTFGEEHPLSRGMMPSDHARNRMVEFRLMGGNTRLVLDPGTTFDDAGAILAVVR